VKAADRLQWWYLPPAGCARRGSDASSLMYMPRPGRRSPRRRSIGSGNCTGSNKQSSALPPPMTGGESVGDYQNRSPQRCGPGRNRPRPSCHANPNSPPPFGICVRAGPPSSVAFDDGRLALDNNPAERALGCIAIGRKNYLFAGSDAGGRRAAAMYSLIETAKLNDINPQHYIADVLARIADHPARQIAELLP
jgi:IS66 C-terminal element/Transposase IS66 family